MNIEDVREYCLAKENVEEGCPFGEDILVFKVNGKMFLLMSISSQPLQFNVKCDPELAIRLRDEYEDILPGYHMNKAHWNTIITGGSVGTKMLKEQIDNSYLLIAASKTNRKKAGK